MAEGGRPIDPGVDIDRALDFYCGALGFELQQRLGDEAAFVPPSTSATCCPSSTATVQLARAR